MPRAKGLMFMTNKEVTKIIFEQFWYLNKCGFREAWSWSDLHGIRKIYEIENNLQKLLILQVIRNISLKEQKNRNKNEQNRWFKASTKIY